ncbi:hypothetical protein LZ30DRAFT_735116 [Colletotrichum cereale]|nr:hypothetical protein LZ30DRAFT_735116 [Colletotrichum cereale]
MPSASLLWAFSRWCQASGRNLHASQSAEHHPSTTSNRGRQGGLENPGPSRDHGFRLLVSDKRALSSDEPHARRPCRCRVGGGACLRGNHQRWPPSRGGRRPVVGLRPSATRPLTMVAVSRSKSRRETHLTCGVHRPLPLQVPARCWPSRNSPVEYRTLAGSPCLRGPSCR